MTAMRLKRYPSPSGGIALGKMGVGATMLRSVLPPGARWVEYLTGDGNSYIDTRIDATSVGAFSINWTTPNQQVKNWEGVFGSASNDAALFRNGTMDQWFLFIGATYKSTAIAKRTKKIVEWRSDGVYFDDELWWSVSKSQLSSNHNNVALFSYNAQGSVCGYSSLGEVVLYGLDRTTELAHFAPIAIGTTGYMLDLVSGEYLPYGNKGTGNFVIGPDINAPAI